MSKYLLPILLLLTTVLAQSPDILPAENILIDPLEVSELNSNSATLRISTSIPVACVVVFGETETFGNMALDQEMGATAHEHHLVIMRGLKADTEYKYRLQGSDSSGNLYASQIMTFRTARAEAGLDLGTNIATAESGAVISNVSSNFGGGENDSRWGANNAIDGQASTEWSSAGDGDDAFITVTLPDVTTVSGFGLWTRTMGSSAEISAFTVENEQGDVFGPFQIDNATNIFNFAAEASGQSFTFRVSSSSGGNTGAVEVAIYKK